MTWQEVQRSILFTAVMVYATVHTASLAYWSSVVLGPYIEPLQCHAVIALGLLQMGPHCLLILGGALLFVDPACRNPVGRLRYGVWGKIHNGRFTKQERFVFASAGTILVFWCQFSGVLVLDFDDRRGTTPQRMKEMTQKGPAYADDHGPCRAVRERLGRQKRTLLWLVRKHRNL